MSAIIGFFKSLIKSVGSMLLWLVGVPAMLYSSFVGFWGTVKSLIVVYTVPHDTLSPALSTLVSARDHIVSFMASMPDVVKIAVYSLSLNTIYHYLYMVLQFYINGLVILLVFGLISVPLLLINLFLMKWTCRFMCAFIPYSWTPSFLQNVANLNVPFHLCFQRLVKYFLNFDKHD